mmetsp:Transcript_10481/g.37999  ORF Transcript_10481/g.37999 Transcript_10481/m.37999 type:complete len:204 (-) Transcript_10481:267-878(-)
MPRARGEDAAVLRRHRDAVVAGFAEHAAAPEREAADSVVLWRHRARRRRRVREVPPVRRPDASVRDAAVHLDAEDGRRDDRLQQHAQKRHLRGVRRFAPRVQKRQEQSPAARAARVLRRRVRGGGVQGRGQGRGGHEGDDWRVGGHGGHDRRHGRGVSAASVLAAASRGVLGLAPGRAAAGDGAVGGAEDPRGVWDVIDGTNE